MVCLCILAPEVSLFICWCSMFRCFGCVLCLSVHKVCLCHESETTVKPSHSSGTSWTIIIDGFTWEPETMHTITMGSVFYWHGHVSVLFCCFYPFPFIFLFLRANQVIDRESVVYEFFLILGRRLESRLLKCLFRLHCVFWSYTLKNKGLEWVTSLTYHCCLSKTLCLHLHHFFCWKISCFV